MTTGILWHCLTAQCEPTTYQRSEVESSFALVLCLLIFGWLLPSAPLKSLLRFYDHCMWVWNVVSFMVSTGPAWLPLFRFSQEPRLRAPTKREDFITAARVRADAPAHLLIPCTKSTFIPISKIEDRIIIYMVLRAGREPFIDHFEVILSSKKEATGWSIRKLECNLVGPGNRGRPDNTPLWRVAPWIVDSFFDLKLPKTDKRCRKMLFGAVPTNQFHRSPMLKILGTVGCSLAFLEMNFL